MNDRMVQWVGAGLLAAGLSSAMLVGANLAAAAPESGTDGGGVSSSQSDGSSGEGGSTAETTSAGAQPDSNGSTAGGIDSEGAVGEIQSDKTEPDETEADEIETDETETDETETDQSGAGQGEYTEGEGIGRIESSGDGSSVDNQADDNLDNKSDGGASTVIEEPAEVQTPATNVDAAHRSAPDASGDDQQAVDTATAVAGDTAMQLDALVAEARAAVIDEPEEATQTVTAALAQVQEAPAAPTGPTLINIVGSFFWGLFDLFSKIIEGPPMVAPGSTVTVGRSTLQIDCGTGYTADADWYFPTDGEPDKFIYFQHGAFATAGMYNYTAAELAERNNAIVVAPSITSNFFACDGCQMAGEQMHAAIANLFLEDRAALLASAKAAGFTGTALPQRFVIAGHSGGGQTAGGAAGWYAQFAPADRLHDMAGVLLLDSSPIGGAIERGVREIPLDIPVYAISAGPGPLNDYGGLNEVLARVRPDFVGVQLIGGVHGDAWQSSNVFAQLLVGIGTGFPQQRNIEAVHVLAQGWIADWFNETHTDELYGERGEVITIDTTAGPARAYVIPGPAPQLTIIDLIIKAFLQSTVLLSQFSGNCAANPSAPPDPELTQNSTPNTVLSLDGKALRGQSVGQHVCTG
jgi:hypothetical protein